MPLIEEIDDEETTSQRSPDELLRVLNQLSARLRLPDDLLPSFMAGDLPEDVVRSYHLKAIQTLQDMRTEMLSPLWDELSTEQQSDVASNIARLYGTDQYTSEEICSLIDEMTAHLDRPLIALHILSNQLRHLFTQPHPLIHPETSRALRRPAGGPEAQSDFHDSATQTFKTPPAWGCYNILSFCVAFLPPDDIEKRIGVILPPTLTMMDDWDPAWRGRGCTVLGKWIDHFPTEMMRRMGLDKLLLDSLIHTLSLHSNPPLSQVMPIALKLIDRNFEGERKAERLSEIMDKALLQGWMYAPSGLEGRPVLINTAKELEMVCGSMGTGIVRWLKSIIPSLLGPLQYPPTAAVTEHYSANLSALICVMRTASSTGRIARWRGQILDVCSRLAVNLHDRGFGGDLSSNDMHSRLSTLLAKVYTELERQCPSITQNEFASLLETNQSTFATYIHAVA